MSKAPQNTPNCTIEKQFLVRHAPNTPPSKIRVMQIPES